MMAELCLFYLSFMLIITVIEKQDEQQEHIPEETFFLSVKRISSYLRVQWLVYRFSIPV